MITLFNQRPLLWAITFFFGHCAGAGVATTYHYKVVESFPHRTDVFTQGLAFEDKLLYESAGQYGESRLLKRTLEDSEPQQQTLLLPSLFAEGMTLLDGKIYQLTWKARRGFIYDKHTLAPEGEFRIPGQGWGLTSDGAQLILSDGSHRLSFMDPKTFTVVKTLPVLFQGQPVYRLNELEWIDGLIYANVWQSHWIIMIDPDDGNVVGKVDLRGLLPVELRTPRTDVLNGIAYDRENQRLLVTGKYWPRIYHIELLAPGSQAQSHSRNSVMD